jgi:hypothetical protein
MTNEEFTEEILFEAHTEGFIDELRTYINNLPIIDQKLPFNEKVQIAYKILMDKRGEEGLS